MGALVYSVYPEDVAESRSSGLFSRMVERSVARSLEFASKPDHRNGKVPW